MMLEPGSVGRAFLQISVINFAIGDFFGRCYVTDALFSNCGYYYEGGPNDETTPREIQMASWHTVRMEVDPSTFTFTYFIDGSNQGSRTLPNAKRIISPSYNVLFVLEGLEVTADFDDLEIGLIN